MSARPTSTPNASPRTVRERLSDPLLIGFAAGLVLGVALCLTLLRPAAAQDAASPLAGGTAAAAGETALRYLQLLAAEDYERAGQLLYVNDGMAWWQLYLARANPRSATGLTGEADPRRSDRIAAARQLRLQPFRMLNAMSRMTAPRLIDVHLMPTSTMGVAGPVPGAWVLVEYGFDKKDGSGPAQAPQWQHMSLLWIDGRWQVAH